MILFRTSTVVNRLLSCSWPSRELELEWNRTPSFNQLESSEKMNTDHVFRLKLNLIWEPLWTRPVLWSWAVPTAWNIMSQTLNFSFHFMSTRLFQFLFTVMISFLSIWSQSVPYGRTTPLSRTVMNGRYDAVQFSCNELRMPVLVQSCRSSLKRKEKKKREPQSARTRKHVVDWVLPSFFFVWVKEGIKWRNRFYNTYAMK